MGSFKENKILARGLQDPKCLAAIQLMQKDPQAAMTKFSKDPEVSVFLSEFGKVMGAHFDKMGAGGSASSSSTSDGSNYCNSSNSSNNSSNKSRTNPVNFIEEVESSSRSSKSSSSSSSSSSSTEMGPLHAKVINQ